MTTTERFSTADVEPSDRLAFWNRITSQTYTRHVVEPRSAAFSGMLLRRSYGDLCVTQVTTSPAVLHSEMWESSPGEREHAFVALQHAGSCERLGHGTRSRLTEGTLALNMLSFTPTVSFDEPTQFVILKLPAARLATRLGDLRRLEELRVEPQDAALLAGFLRTLLGRDEPTTDPGWDAALGDVVVDLITLTYRAASLTRPRPAPRAGSAERWQRTVRDFVDRHLGDPELSPAMLADRLGVTPRYIQMVFAQMTTTASAYILMRRLELAARLLTSGGPPIAEVSLRAGFGDLSYFYRSFRKRFGVSPGRYAAQRTG